MMWAYEWAEDYWVRVVEWKEGAKGELRDPIVEVPGKGRYEIGRVTDAATGRCGYVGLRPVTREEYEKLPSSVRFDWRTGVEVLGTVI